MTKSDLARKAFEEAGLSYARLREGDILALVLLLNRSFRNLPEGAISTLHLSKKIILKKKSNGAIRECFLFVNSHYFQQRECISFNRDGFIGFCGWADSYNEAPIISAFLEWVDLMKGVVNA